MTADLREDLRTYLDELVRRMEVPATDVGPHAREVRIDDVDGPPTPSRRRWLVAAAFAGLVVSSIAVLLVWSRSSTEVQIADPPSMSTSTSDPLTWQRSELSTNLSGFADAAGFRGEVVAVGTDDVTRAVAARSPDGITWDTEAPMSGGSGQPVSIAADTATVVAVGTSAGAAAAWVSEDARAWSRHRIDGAEQIHAVTDCDSGFIAVGTSRLTPEGTPETEPIPAAWQSPDGRRWDRVPLPPLGPGEARDVASSGPVSVIIGTVGSEPVTWSNASVIWTSNGPGQDSDQEPSGRGTAVSWSDGRFVLVGAQYGKPGMWETADGNNIVPIEIDPIVDSDGSGSFQDVAVAGDTIVATFPSQGYQSLADVPVWARRDGTWEVTLRGAVGLSPWNDRVIATGDGAWISSPTP